MFPAWTITNQGIINGSGVFTANGGLLSNAKSAFIRGATYRVDVSLYNDSTNTDVVQNSGYIDGTVGAFVLA